MANRLTLDEKLTDLGSAIELLNRGVHIKEESWERLLDRVTDVEDALRNVRRTVRARATKEKRIFCPHPEDTLVRYRDFQDNPTGTGKCLQCGKSFKNLETELTRPSLDPGEGA